MPFQDELQIIDHQNQKDLLLRKEDRLAQIRARAQAGFYDKKNVIKDIVDSLIQTSAFGRTL